MTNAEFASQLETMKSALKAGEVTQESLWVAIDTAYENGRLTTAQLREMQRVAGA